MPDPKFGIPPCPYCNSKQDVKQTDFTIIKGNLEQRFYCADCDRTFVEETNLLENICPRFEQWGKAMTVVCC
jgi:hypothetical protein